MRRFRPLASTPLPLLGGAFGLALGLAACEGNIGGDDATPDVPDSTATSFLCDPSEVPEAMPLRRLSRRQYDRTIDDLATFLVPTEAEAVIAEARAGVTLVSDQLVGEDKHYARLTRMDQTVQQGHIDGAYRLGLAVGEAATATNARLEASVGACATDGDVGNDVDCVEELIRRFGERALRRPVTDEDVAFYREHIGGAPYEPADYAEVIALLLNAPHLFYFVEHGEGPDSLPSAPLRAYELASRLSYHFWQTLPDDALFESARSGELLTDAGYLAQVERIYQDPRTGRSLQEFFGEWLQNSTLEPLDSRIGTPAFDTLRGDFTPSSELRGAMWDEVTDSAVYYAQHDGSYADFLTSDRSFARGEELAGLYGVPAWDGASEPPAFTDPAHAGLLTRAAYVATGSASTRPIMKGVFIRKALLCDTVGEPPADAPTSVELEGEASTRDFVDALTSPASCVGCHANQINGLGFASENFDALGRSRLEELLIDRETGEITATVPVDTTSAPRIEYSDDRETSGVGEMNGHILESDKPYACFSRLYFRYTFGRYEDFNRDSCALASVKDQLDEGASMGDALVAIALDTAFRTRSFAE